MSKKLRRGIFLATLMMFGAGSWLGCGDGMEKCPFCGKEEPISNMSFHKRKCKKNTTDQRMNKPAGGKTTGQ